MLLQNVTLTIYVVNACKSSSNGNVIRHVGVVQVQAILTQTRCPLNFQFALIESVLSEIEIQLLRYSYSFFSHVLRHVSNSSIPPQKKCLQKISHIRLDDCHRRRGSQQLEISNYASEVTDKIKMQKFIPIHFMLWHYQNTKYYHQHQQQHNQTDNTTFSINIIAKNAKYV